MTDYHKNNMTKKIAILRGINVGKKRRILMADLILLFENLGFTNIKTYIQSGNIFFTTKRKVDSIELADIIENTITEKYGFEVPVIIRSADELEAAIKTNPFYQSEATDIKQLHLTFLKELPAKENLLQTETYNFEPDQFAINNKEVFVFCNGKYHKSKLTNNFFERKLKVAATTRNWKTVLKLLELAS